MKFVLIALLFSFLVQAETRLLLVGGGNRPTEAMQTFAQYSGNGQILIIPWASASIASAEIIRSELTPLTKAKIHIIAHQLSSSDVVKLHQQIATATGIFFTGGDQNALMKSIRNFKVSELFRKRFLDGIIFGGTSAGTAIMSDPMLTGEADLSVIDGSKVELANGLGLLPQGVIADQHFIVRSRFNRLAGLIQDKKALIGIGVDENTSLMILGNEAKVMGPSQVLFFKMNSSKKLEVTILGPEKTINLSELLP
jgi:cyanophycinase